MSTVLGQFFEVPQSQQHHGYLKIVFSPVRFMPLKQFWHAKNLSATFIADYFNTFYADQFNESLTQAQQEEIDDLWNSIRYVTNELIGNILKFQAEAAGVDAEVCLYMRDKTRLVFCIIHAVTEEQATVYQAHIQKLLTSEIETLYAETLIKDGSDLSLHSSGLGLISMICDHDAQLGWKFEPLPSDGAKTYFKATTTAQLLLENDDHA